MKQHIVYVVAMLVLFGCSKKVNNKSISDVAIIDSASNGVKEVIGIGKIVPKDDILNLASPLSGIITRVYATDGDTVTAGNPLLHLDNKLDLIDVEQVSSQIKTQQSQIQIEEAAFKEVDTKLSYKKRLLVSANRLFTEGAETKQHIDDLGEEIKTLESTLIKAGATVQYSKNKLKELENQLEREKVENSQNILVAPCSGIILQIQKKQGEALNGLETYATLAPTGHYIIDAEIDELFSDQVAVGMPASIHLIGNKNIIGEGVVSSVAPYLKKKSLFSETKNDQEDRRVRSVKITLQHHPNLLINTKVECKIKIR